jgi:S-formylglutathione hydrolase FrmB
MMRIHTAPLVIALLLGSAPAPASVQTGLSTQNPAAAATQLEYGSIQSASLGRELKYGVLLPPSYAADPKRRYPVLYFLHGMNGNEREFERRGVAGAVNKLRADGKVGEMIIVTPAGENSFYMNAKNGVRYEDAIVKDLIPHIEKSYRVMGTPRNRAIQGISMGGFGATMIAFKHPEMFSSVTAHSAALFAELPKPTGSDRRSLFVARLVGNIFGDPPDDAFFRSNNPIHLVEANASAIKKAGLKIYFDVGDQDRYGFQDSNKILDERATRAGVPHEFHVFPGGHGWEYMISVAEHSYSFLWKNLGNSGKGQPSSR